MYKIFLILLFTYGLAITTADIYDNSWGLIIGINKYENVQTLSYAVKDAESIQEILVNTFNFPEANITLLKNEDANKQAILKAFSELTKKADNNDRVLIYFAGHGQTMDLPEGGEMGYLLPVDGDSEDLYLSSIGMDELEKISHMSKAKHTLYLIDACYGGIAAVGSRGLDATSTSNYIDKITKNRAVQIITAGGRGEQVIEKPKWGHSAFTLNINRGLRDGNADMNGDGYITANELGMFLSEKVTIDSENQQTPQYGRMTSQEGEFVFVYAENTSAIQDKSADEKLDYLILEMEELKSQKFTGDEKIAKKTVDGTNGYFKKYGYERHGMSLVAFEDVFTVGYSTNLNKNWRFSIAYASLGNKTYNRLISVHDSHLLTSKGFALNLNYNYYITDEVLAFSGGGTIFNMVSWQDAEQDKSGNYQLIFPSLAFGLAVYPFQLVLMDFQMSLGISSGFLAHFIPTSYEIDVEDIVTTKDWRIIFSPLFSLEVEIPHQ